MKKMLIYIILSIFLLSTQCERYDIYHNDIIIKNNSSNIISVSPCFTFPDTTINCPPLYYNVEHGSEYSFHERYGWEPSLSNIYFQLFILDPSVVKSTPCDTIKKYKMYIKRYQLSVDDLNRMNWIITYP